MILDIRTDTQKHFITKMKGDGSDGESERSSKRGFNRFRPGRPGGIGGGMETVIASLITGVLTLIGAVIANSANSRKIEQKLDKAQAVTDCKIEELTREVREHNNFARRMPVIEEQIKVANHRIADLEQGK